MSNPFATFRKNRTYWMASLVLLAILAFVVAPAIEQASQALRSATSTEGVAVRWNGGKLTMDDLRVAAQKHASLVRFLTAVASEVVDAGGQPRVPGFAANPQNGQILGLGIQPNSDDFTICRMRLLAAHAKKLGIEFDDQAIDQFLIAFCDDRIPTDRLETILNESTDRTLGIFEVRELLKQELSVMVASQLASIGISSLAPGKTYRDFLKLNQTARVEAFPVSVDDYLDKVTAEPTEQEIQEIYDAGRNREANSESSEPGFVRPYQANVEYITANLQDWINREKEKLTEEQLRKEYDRRAQLGQLQVAVTSPPEAEDAPATPDSDPPKEGDNTQRVPTDAADDETPEPPATESPATESPTTEPPSTESPATGETPTEPPAADKPAADDQALRRADDVRLVSYLQDENADVPPPVVQPPQFNQGSATGGDAGASDAGGAPEMRTQTFEEARDTIADSLARTQAIPALDEALTDLFENVMKPYYSAARQHQAYVDADITPKDESGNPLAAPVKPDLKKLAEEKGLEYIETGLVDYSTLSRTPFGQGSVRPDESGLQGPVAQVVMAPQVALFRPMRSTYFDRSALQRGEVPDFLQYLLWKTDEQAMYVPELSEVRQEVVDTWKRQRARELAEEAANVLAKKVNGSSEEPWKAALSTAEQALILSTDPFSWLSRVGDGIATTTVPGLAPETAGSQFMNKVFATAAGGVTVAPSQSQNVYYVVRVVELSPSLEDLQQRFNADPNKMGPMTIARLESDDLVRDWFPHLEKEMGVQWEFGSGELN